MFTFSNQIFLRKQKLMRDNNQSDGRQMVQGDWKCSECGAAITELPFEPDGDRPLYCRDCHRQRRQSRPGRF